MTTSSEQQHTLHHSTYRREDQQELKGADTEPALSDPRAIFSQIQHDRGYLRGWKRVLGTQDLAPSDKQQIIRMIDIWTVIIDTSAQNLHDFLVAHTSIQRPMWLCSKNEALAEGTTALLHDWQMLISMVQTNALLMRRMTWSVLNKIVSQSAPEANIFQREFPRFATHNPLFHTPSLSSLLWALESSIRAEEADYIEQEAEKIEWIERPFSLLSEVCRSREDIAIWDKLHHLLDESSESSVEAKYYPQLLDTLHAWVEIGSRTTFSSQEAFREVLRRWMEDDLSEANWDIRAATLRMIGEQTSYAEDFSKRLKTMFIFYDREKGHWVHSHFEDR